MRVLESWLRDFIAFDYTPEELSQRLGLLGLELEGFEYLGKKYQGFVVGKVLERQPHPNADRLTVCRVTLGEEQLQIVCGAPNVQPGQHVVVGKIGATVPHNQHDPQGQPFVLSRVKIRGVESEGMICSERELDLGENGDGILVLPELAPIGQPLASWLDLDDVAYDVEVTPNRPDWLSHIGIAREIGILTGKKPKLPTVKLREGGVPISRHLTITVDDTVNCLRFAARMVRGVSNGTSPPWLQRRLERAGLRPRNILVDVTNYVMMECGQPLHAFDHRLLQGGQLIIRQAKPGSRFRTLDGIERDLPPGAVIIADAEREVSIAGVMGGENSEIGPGTTDVVIESAKWLPQSIRKTAKALGISTDASQRFERGTDPDGILYALDRATSMIHELAGGEILKGVIDIVPRKPVQRNITLRTKRTNDVLGTELKTTEVRVLLARLGMKMSTAPNNSLHVTPPTYRVDIVEEIDLVEEVARVYGYDNIEEKTSAYVDFEHEFKKRNAPDEVRQTLIGWGYQEVLTNSMQDERRSSLSGQPVVHIRNPQNQEMNSMRTSLLPGLLDLVSRNLSFGNENLKLFEVGRVFRLADAIRSPSKVRDIVETEHVCLVMTGLPHPPHWSKSARAMDFFDVKGEVTALLDKFLLDKYLLICYSTSDCLDNNQLAIEINGSYAGYVGNMKKEILASFGIEQEVFVAEVDLALLPEHEKPRFEALPRFPKVKRDLAFIVNAEINVADVEKTIHEAASTLLQRVTLFDVYSGERVSVGKKSLAFSLELMSRSKTLSESEIEQELQEIVSAVERKCNARVRSI